MRDMILGLRAVLVTVAMATCATTLGGCQSFTDFCTAKNDCEEGNEFDFDACIIGTEAADDLASDFGCSDEYDIFLDCFFLKGECTADEFILEGNDCDDELRDFEQCSDPYSKVKRK